MCFVLHGIIPGISPLCLFCQTEDETLKHHFWLCLLAKATQYGIDLCLRVDGLRITSIKEQIKEWLSKPDLQQSNALWFYGQFVCNLWCIWIHKNEVVFKNQQSNPLKVLFHQKAILKGIALTNQEKTGLSFSFHHDYKNHSKWTQSIQHMSSLGEINTKPIILKHGTCSWR